MCLRRRKPRPRVSWLEIRGPLETDRRLLEPTQACEHRVAESTFVFGDRVLVVCGRLARALVRVCNIDHAGEQQRVDSPEGFLFSER